MFSNTLCTCAWLPIYVEHKNVRFHNVFKDPFQVKVENEIRENWSTKMTFHKNMITDFKSLVLYLTLSRINKNIKANINNVCNINYGIFDAFINEFSLLLSCTHLKGMLLPSQMVKKICMYCCCMEDNSWVTKINMNNVFSARSIHSPNFPTP